MKSKDRELTAQRLDEIARQGLGTGGIERLLKHRQIGGQVLGLSVNRNGIRLIARNQHLESHQMRGKPPRFLGVLQLQSVDDGILVTTFELGCKTRKQVLERGRHLLEMPTQRQVVRETFKLPCKKAQCVETQRCKRVRGHLGRHSRMSVTITTDPSAETNHRRHLFQIIEREARLLPSLAKMRVRARNCFRKNLTQVEQCVFKFLIDAWARDMDLTGAPQCFQARLERAASALALPLGKGRVLTLLHDVVNLAMAFAHGLAFRLGRMSGEHRLEAHLSQHFKNPGGIESHVTHRGELVGPESFFRGRTMGLFAPAADLRRHAFFDDVQELKRDRISLTQAAVSAVGIGKRLAAPWQTAGKVGMAEAFEHDAERFHGKGELGLQKLESVIEQRFFNVLGICGHGWRVKSSTNAGSQASTIVCQKSAPDGRARRCGGHPAVGCLPIAGISGHISPVRKP